MTLQQKIAALLVLMGLCSLCWAFCAAFHARLNARVLPFDYGPFWVGLLCFVAGLMGSAA